ncbi:sterol-binding protein [Streptomyces ochraceiscleroticus]|uniref:Sterol-binding protein n=1 Tax=Streptomyces ochraceiscleroticus TaxID=47761 RepID=A0ABW1MQ45_9ACTN|nr:sterol-binding protein [Streptomyces ochraceiscleroticus]
MASLEQCRAALDRLAQNLSASPDGAVRGAAAVDRSLSCRITDLDVTFVGRLVDGTLMDVTAVPGPPPDRAQIRLAMTGDDLVAMVDGELHFARAWGSGRVKLEAGFRDLLRLRTLL